MRENTADKSLFDKNLIKRLLLSALFGLILFVVLCCLFSLAVLKIPSLSDKSFFLAVAALAVSALICGFLSAKNRKIKGIVSGSISGFVMCVAVYIVAAAASGFSFSYKAVIILPTVMILSIAGAILKKNI